jgi:micrococcal nuclease
MGMKGLNEGRLFIAIIIAGFFIGLFYYLAATSTCATCAPGLAGYASEVELSDEPVGEFRIVTRVIDGDTIVVSGGDHVRLLGMDADERGDPCYKYAKGRLEELVLDKEVYLEPDTKNKDQYGRLLRYIILDGENINLMLVEEGFAIARFYSDNVKYKNEIANAEKAAMENSIGCEWGQVV